MIQLLPSDFEVVGQLAKHCDLTKLNVAVEEAVNFDLKPLLCDLFSDVVENWEVEEGDFYNLINGGTYENCKGKEIGFLGLKRVLIYYAYARYTALNSFNDTPNGSVTKTNNFSIPKPLKEVEMFSDKYRTMGYRTWKETERYLCQNREVFTDFNSKNCKGCGCNDLCDSKTNSKGYGIKGGNVWLA